jgi:hypothetical protein
MNLLNYYKCSECGETWQDIWEGAVDDRCPTCSTSNSPYKSADISPLDEQPIKSLIKGLIEKIKREEKNETDTYNEILSALKSAGDCEFLDHNATKTASYLLKLAGIDNDDEDED